MVTQDTDREAGAVAKEGAAAARHWPETELIRQAGSIMTPDGFCPVGIDGEGMTKGFIPCHYDCRRGSGGNAWVDSNILHPEALPRQLFPMENPYSI